MLQFDRKFYAGNFTGWLEFLDGTCDKQVFDTKYPVKLMGVILNYVDMRPV